MEKLCSTEIDKSEYTITEQKDEGGEVTYDVPNFNVSNVFECGRNNPDVSYKRAYMVTEVNESFMDIIDTLNKYQDRQGQILSSKNFSKKLFSASWNKKKKKLNVT